MKIYNSFNEMAEGTGALSANVEGMAFVDNMSPAILQYGNMKFYPGLEDPNKRKHVHVRLPDGEGKFWLEPLEYEPKGRKGKFRETDIQQAQKQIEAHYDTFVESIDKLQQGEKVPKQKGHKIKGKNRKTDEA